ncbi:uncharacterized protein LOC120651693 isoform X2 [Panicum virgatum]|uniref:Ternary complex factor MIP1 leucine-zipper domain-containing protein n=1 Tax=Panicum virgatum TaxID=38727 RepID=A0A8T0NQN9_PANVG|nr:uncharacterized protein LOC120651693 isoform X2 [Panicum virgatum]KAG2550569.1 hypothetical protein PVAP13_9KG328400 [Panicum virgatum]
MTGQEEEMVEQAGGAVATGGQGPAEKNHHGEPEAAVSAACAPKAAAAVPASLPPRHRRSKSASSDRNAEACKHHGAAEQRCGQAAVTLTPCSSKNPPETRRSWATAAGGSAHQGPRDRRPNASPNHRVSLENDVRQLQLHLHQESSIRVMLDRAIGQAASTLSPGHRHFPAQTKELIAEIELLEEEIANREQHVLTLYRSIFDQCMSGPSSGQSSGISSPAHTKNITTRARTRRQPSIISNAFCSSKKLPIQPFHIMESLSESGRTKNMVKAKIKHQSFSSETLDIHPTSFPPDPKKLPYSGSSSLARALKDHLYQCPSKISEEMVRCMASIYYLLRTEAPEKSEKARSPFLSKSSTNVILPQRVNGEENNSSNSKCTVEIASISVDKNQMPDVSYAITHYRLLVEQLERVDLSMSEKSIKLTFWINVYNSLIMHAYLAYGVPNSSLKRMALFHKAAYNIGGHAVTANSVEHALLCFRSPRLGRWFESILLTAMMRKKCADEKQLVQLKFGLPDCQPLVLFALCTGASSDPMLRVYTAKNVMEELERAKREFLQATVVVRKSKKKVFLPRLVERYAREASLGPDDVLPWAQREAGGDGRAQQDDAAAVQRGAGSRRKAAQAVEWLPYAARFRYAFARSMVDKPHC